ncbi:MAG: Flavodoxin [Promethearchaeota archaeon]|nr:MAG: Flavodoxin [Candidatus Lokiarchaeota archaeon]
MLNIIGDLIIFSIPNFDTYKELEDCLKREGKAMKILITYFSQTGNTERVAKSFKEALAEHEVDINPIAQQKPDELSDYDFLILGSGIYAGKIHKSVENLIKKAERLPPKVALFNTHSSISAYQHGFKRVKQRLEVLGAELIGEWDCRGENIGVPEQIIEQRLANLPPDERKKAEEDIEELKGRPNAEDLENAKTFAKSLL